ncbi:MAG: helix-turn-helix transcriptional regulator [Acidobacteria bacterium]|nr:helix-turn-helix transcriptional regulator [Acidobacteriota bacterium]
MVTTARAIAARLVTLGLSQRRFAAMLRVSQPALNGWLNGHTRPPMRFVERATAFLDVMEEAERAADAAREEVLSRMHGLQPFLMGSRPHGVERRGHGDPGDPDAAANELPEVLFLEELAGLLRCHPKTIKRRMEAGVFPVAPIPGIDSRPRWSKAAVLQWLAASGAAGKPARRPRGR